MACIVWKMDNAIYWINHYPVDNMACFVTVHLPNTGPPRQWKPIKWQNWNKRFQHIYKITIPKAALSKCCQFCHPQEIICHPLHTGVNLSWPITKPSPAVILSATTKKHFDWAVRATDKVYILHIYKEHLQVKRIEKEHKIFPCNRANIDMKSVKLVQLKET